MIGVDADPKATPDQTRFVVASRQAATRRRALVVAIAVCVALVAATMGVFAWTQRSTAMANEREANAQRATAERQRDRRETGGDRPFSAVAAASTASLAQETARGALLAIEAYATAPTPEALDALHRAASRRSTWSKRCARTRVACTRWTSVRTANCRSAGNDGTLTIADAATGELVVPPIAIGSPTWASPRSVRLDPRLRERRSPHPSVGSNDRKAPGSAARGPSRGRQLPRVRSGWEDPRLRERGPDRHPVGRRDPDDQNDPARSQRRGLRGGLQPGWRAAGDRGAIV